MKLCCPLRSVCLFRQENKWFVYLHSFLWHYKWRKGKKDLPLFILSSPKLQIAPLNFNLNWELSVLSVAPPAHKHFSNEIN